MFGPRRTNPTRLGTDQGILKDSALTKLPPYHWWRTVFFLIPAIAIYTIVLGAASIVSSLIDRRGYFAHGCARAWSWLILKTTGVRVTVEGLERIVPGTTYVFVSNHQSI